MMIYLRVAIVFSLLLVNQFALACSCTYYGPAENFQRSDYVFIANLVAVDDPTSTTNGTYHFSVSEILKGSLGSSVEAWFSSTPHICGVQFSPDDMNTRYLIFASGMPPFRFHLCDDFITPVDNYEQDHPGWRSQLFVETK